MEFRTPNSFLMAHQKANTDFQATSNFYNHCWEEGRKKPVPLPSAGWTGRTTMAKKNAGLFSSFSKALSGNVYHEAIIYEAVRDSIISPSTWTALLIPSQLYFNYVFIWRQAPANTCHLKMILKKKNSCWDRNVIYLIHEQWASFQRLNGLAA